MSKLSQLSQLKISVVIPVRNSSGTLQDAFDSIYQQTYSNYEIIVVDGLSTDGTVRLAQAQGEKVAKLISEKDSGTSDAINKGVNLCSGEIVTFLLADDVLSDKNAFAIAAEAFESDLNLGMLFGAIRVTDPSGLANDRVDYSNPQELYRRVALNFPGSFYRKSLLDRPAMDCSLKIANDYEFVCRHFLGKGLKIRTVPNEFVCMRYGGMSGRAENDFRHTYEKFKIRRKYFGIPTALTIAVGAFSIAALRKANIRPFTWYRKIRRFVAEQFSSVGEAWK